MITLLVFLSLIIPAKANNSFERQFFDEDVPGLGLEDENEDPYYYSDEYTEPTEYECNSVKDSNELFLEIK